MTTEDLGDLAPLAEELAASLAPTIQLGGLLGRGGMGAVFLGRDPALKRSVVIKVLSPELAHDETARRRFAREAESAAAVSHPNVVSVHLVGELPRSKTAYFVMQHVDGVTLGDACPEGVKIPAARVRRIVGEVASALAAAHARGLVHRDIKPANVMLEKGTERAIVLDFGISAALRKRDSRFPTPDSRLTQQGASIGTPQYMSPEQAAGEEVSGKSDIYSLGVVAFELLAGRPPFEASNPMALAAAHIKDPPPDLLKLRPDLDSGLSDLIARMLAKPAAARPDAGEVSRALLPSAHALVEWPPPGLERLQGSLSRGIAWLVGSMGAVLVFLSLLLLQPVLDEATFTALAALTGVGAIAVLVGGSLAIGLAGSRIVWARQSGYPWWTAIDAGLDGLPDTGQLLNAAGRYAALEPGGGWRLVRRRRWAALGLLAGVLASSVLIFAWAVGSFGLPNDSLVPIAPGELAVLMAPVLLGLVGWQAVMARERKLRRLVRPREERVTWRRWKPAPVPAELVGGWLGSAGVAAPPVRAAWRHVLLRNAFETPTAMAGLLFQAAIVATVMGAVFLPRAAREDNRARILWRQEALESARGGGFPALDAALSRAARAPASGAADTSAALSLVGPSADNREVDLNAVWRAFSLLPGRLPDSLRQVLAGMAATGERAGFERLAASAPLPAAWYATREMKPGTDSFQRLRRVTGAMSRAAVRHAAGSALALASGNRGAAEQQGREILAVGRQLWREPLPGAAAVGLGVLDVGVGVLRGVALAAGDRALTREVDSLAGVLRVRRDLSSRFASYRFANYIARPGDTLALVLVGSKELAPADRWAVMRMIAHGACWNPVEIRRGVSRERRAMLAEAARRAADIERSDVWAASLAEDLDQVDAVLVITTTELPWVMRWLKPALRSTLCGGGRQG